MEELFDSYKAFTIPLEVRGDTNKAKLVFFDQYYYDGPSKFINKTDITKSPKYTDHVTTYNQLITSYERVFNKSDVDLNDMFIWKCLTKRSVK